MLTTLTYLMKQGHNYLKMHLGKVKINTFLLTKLRIWPSLFSMKSVVDLGNNVYQELPATAIVIKFTSPYACILINHKWKSATAF